MLELKYAKQSFYARKWVASRAESEPEQVEEGDQMERLHSMRCLRPRKDMEEALGVTAQSG